MKFVIAEEHWYDSLGRQVDKAHAVTGEVWGTLDGEPHRVYLDYRLPLAASGTIGETSEEETMAQVETPTAPVATDVPAQWRSVLAVEGIDTSDERRLAEGSVGWRPLPLTLMGQIVTADGHNEARVVGRIDRIERQGANIVGEGTFTDDEFGQQVMAWVGDGTLRGISIDLAIDDFETEPYDDAPPAEDDLLDLFGPPGIMVVTKGTIMGATITPFPAFAEATIMLASAVIDERRRHLLRIGSMIFRVGDDGETITMAFPPAKPAGPPAAPKSPAPDAPAGGKTDPVTTQKIVSDLTEVAQDYAGVNGSINVTIDGSTTKVAFPDSGTADPDAGEDVPGAPDMAAAVRALTRATKTLAQIAEAGQ